MELKFRVWDIENNAFLQQIGTLSIVELTYSKFRVDVFTGVTLQDGTEIWENDIVAYDKARGFKRWWSSVTDIPEIEREYNDMLSNKRTYYEKVIFDRGSFRLEELYCGELTRASKQKEERGTNGDLTTIWDNFRKIGNVWEIPDFEVSKTWMKNKDEDKWRLYEKHKNSPFLNFVCGFCRKDAGEPERAADGSICCEQCDYMLTQRTGGGMFAPFNWYAKFTHGDKK